MSLIFALKNVERRPTSAVIVFLPKARPLFSGGYIIDPTQKRNVTPSVFNRLYSCDIPTFAA